MKTRSYRWWMHSTTTKLIHQVNALRRVPTLLLVLTINLNGYQSLLMSQDIIGGASIFIGHPKNPPVRRRKSAKPKSDKASTSKSDEQTNDSNESQPDMNDEVEDALALGNTARDANPPRYQDAELAYRLAKKLNPKDPRPYIGLGNIWYDQKQHAEAATMYKEALVVMASDSSGRKWTVRGQTVSAAWKEHDGEWRAYLGNTLLRARDFSEAEIEFRNATSKDSRNAQWQALLGYSLLQQGKFEDASVSFKLALRFDPKNDEYQQLLQLSLDRKKK